MFKTILFFCCLAIISCGSTKNTGKEEEIPVTFIGKFSDDYDIHYSVSKTVFLQEPNVRYHILEWNVKEQYIIAKNDADNPSEKGLYTRIDYMLFENMQPYKWGFCFTVYNAQTHIAAKQAAAADRSNPKKGCGGFPFSRMKRVK